MKIFLTLIAFFALLASFTNPYCKCEKSESIETEIEQSDLVIVGDVVSKNIISNFVRDESGLNHNILLIMYEIKVHKSYKGVNKDKKIFLYTTKGVASCGLVLKGNTRYTIFGTKGSYIPSSLEKLLGDSERCSYWSSSCSRTAVSNIEIEKEIEKSINS